MQGLRIATMAVLVVTFLGGWLMMTLVMKRHLREWGEPTLRSLLKKKTPEARKRAKRFFLGMALCCVSMPLMLWLGPVRL